MAIHDDEPRTEKFKEVSKLPDEPKSDVAIEADGMRLRERVRKQNTQNGFSLIFTYARYDEAGLLMMDDFGNVLISDPHEVQISAEGAMRSGESGLKKTLQHGRAVAVARAVDHFSGLEVLPDKLADLLGSRV